MKIFFHTDFYEEYTADPAAEPGRMEAIVQQVEGLGEVISCLPASEEQIGRAHTKSHINQVWRTGLYEIAALAAGGAIQAADAALHEPSFGLIRPPGHHASADSCWGFCYFNNMAISLYHLQAQGKIKKAFVLDFDFHFGDGNVNILERETWVEILNPAATSSRKNYLAEVRAALEATNAEIIAVSAGFDHHVNDWGGLLYTEDYQTMGRWVREIAGRNGGGCYGLLEGGYNHNVLGGNVYAFLKGLDTV